MATGFDQILDECIDRIAKHGGTVDECLDRYPHWASDLEPYLRLSTTLASSQNLPPSPRAKELGRARLLAELTTLQQRDANKRAGFPLTPSLLLGWQLRWVAAAAVIILTVLISAGGGLVALQPVQRCASAGG